METRIRILTADPNREFCRQLSELMTAEGDMEIIGMASDGLEALERVAELKPDLLLLELVLPKLDTRPSTEAAGQRYNIVLCTVQSHGKAFEMIQKLPDPYRDKAIVDSADSESFTLILDVKLEKKKAQELSRALKHTFGECQITPSE